MSDTPRVDKVLDEHYTPAGPMEYLARRLERELAHATWELNERRGLDKAREEDRLAARQQLAECTEELDALWRRYKSLTYAKDNAASHVSPTDGERPECDRIDGLCPHPVKCAWKKVCRCEGEPPQLMRR